MPVFCLRSEEHTSELQSPCNLVCRLLLEKKKVIAVRELWITSAIRLASSSLLDENQLWFAINRLEWLHRLFFFNDTATTEIYTLSLHDALPIWPSLKISRREYPSLTIPRLPISSSCGRPPSSLKRSSSRLSTSTYFPTEATPGCSITKSSSISATRTSPPTPTMSTTSVFPPISMASPVSSSRRTTATTPASALKINMRWSPRSPRRSSIPF